MGTLEGELHADCGRCFGLCCVVPAFARSADFAIDKPAGTACGNLGSDFRCGIHDRLRDRGFKGCTVYDCFGAGQRVSQVTFEGLDWRGDQARAARMFKVFPVMRDLHELLYYLAEAQGFEGLDGGLEKALLTTYDRIDGIAGGSPEQVTEADVAALRPEVNALLLRASEAVRAKVGRRKDHRGADLMGARLRKADLRGASLRGAYLIGADFRDADLRLADVIGADFRNADLRGADLTGALFLTQAQLDAARGDARTGIPARLSRPTYWTA